MKSSQRCLVAVLVVLASLVPASAQSSQGRILGRVTDSSGAVVPKAQVIVANTETGIERKLETNEAGEYSAPNLPAGLYSVTASAPTFKTTRRANIRLEVATEFQIDLQLRPGDVAQVEEVSGEAPLVDTVSDTLGGTMTNKLINELPLQGRDFQNLLELRPGIQRTPGGGFHSVTTNGNRLEDNNYIVDGTDDNDLYYGETVINGAGVAGTPASHLPLDAIQEFNTQENQGSEYGWKPGAVVNIGLKSGTNDFHGTAYYFHRNSAFDARNYFNPDPQPISDLLMHDFGVSAGGPIIKNKWFIFGNYEGVRHKVGNPFDVLSPITEPFGDPEISLPDAMADAGCPAACSDVSLTLAGLFLNNPGNTSSSGIPAEINFNFNNVNREDNFIVKTDYKLNEKNLITGRYFYANSNQTEEDTAPIRPEWLSLADTKVQVMGVNWTWTPGRLVNEARFGYNRNWQLDDVADHNRSADSYGLNTGVTDPRLFGFPSIDVGPFTMGGNSSWPLYTTPNYTYQFVDNVSITKGAHNIRFGGEFRHGGSDNFRARRGRGRIVFDSLDDFLQGNVDFAQVLIGDTHRNVTMNAFGAFIQDDWRVSRNVTLNLGLRYDLSTPIKDANDQLANFIPDQNGLIQVGHGINSLYDKDTNNLSPRLGVAWDVFGTGKTVVRAGGAIIYEQATIRQFIDRGGFNENPSGVTGVSPGTGTIDVASREIDDSASLSAAWNAGTPLFNTTPNALVCDQDDPCDVRGVLPHLATPYVAQWNFNIQQELGPKTVLQVAYVGNHGIKLYSLRDINQAIPQLSADCYFDTFEYDACRQAARPFVLNCTNGSGKPCMPWVGYANELENLGNSIYHGLQATLTQRSYKGLDILLGYTYAHAIDTTTSNRSGFPADNRFYFLERGNGDYDIRHRFTMSLNYEVPKFKAPLQMGQGWQVTSILNLQTGEPMSFYDSFDDFSFTNEQLDRWDFAGDPGDVHWSRGPKQAMTYLVGTDATSNPLCAAHNRNPDLDFYGCFVSGSAVLTPPNYGTFGNQGRNIFRGPGFANLDMSISKRWNLSERIAIQLRGEFFNILNHPNFDLFTIGTDVSDPVDFETNDLGIANATPDVGVANPVVGSGGSRHIQLGLKVIW